MESLRTISLVFGVSFLLNLVWENIHVSLYDIHMIPMDPYLICLRAAIWDAVIITGVYMLVDTKSRKTRYIFSVLACIAVAIFIEMRALAEGRWGYLPTMPLMMGIGISPLIQLPLLAILTYEIVRRIPKKD